MSNGVKGSMLMEYVIVVMIILLGGAICMGEAGLKSKKGAFCRRRK